MPKFQLVLLIHAHQPVGNFDDVFERSYAHSYKPFVDVLEKHPAIRAGLHYSGPLLEWMERAHPEYFDRLRAMVKSGQAEMVSGGFYEPVLIAIPPQDRLEQIKRLADYIEKHFGARPTGAWLTERVWEPQIPSSLAPAEVDYTLVDDNHFLGAGFELDQLYGHYIAEDLGHKVKLIPGLKPLRYMIPFRDIRETIAFSAAPPAGTSKRIRGDGRRPGKIRQLAGHLRALLHERLAHKLFLGDRRMPRVAGGRDARECVGFPRAAGPRGPPRQLHTPRCQNGLCQQRRGKRYHDLLEEFAARPEALPFLRGGVWRNFFMKYSESNLMHKKMLHVSEKVKRLAQSKRRDRSRSFTAAREDEASTLLLQRAVQRRLLARRFRRALFAASAHGAVALAGAGGDDSRRAGASEARVCRVVQKFDFDADGRDEIYFTSQKYAALVTPDDGGTISAIDFRPANATLINSLMRRPEAYHAARADLRESDPLSVESIHDQRRTKEEGLDRWLKYDRWPRNAFRLLVFGQRKTLSGLRRRCSLEEDAAAGGRTVSR